MIHSTDNSLEGTSRYFQDRDPWLAYQRGKNLTQFEFRNRDGVFPKIATFAGKQPDGFTPKIVANDQVSCAGCHNFPYREAGAGTNFARLSGRGRNSPHFFGAGLMEMVAVQLRQKMLQQMDPNQDGWVAKSEMNSATVAVAPVSWIAPLAYGRNGDLDANGRPDLNKIFEVWYVDAAGHRLAAATSLSSASVEGFNFWPVFWGWGDVGGGLNPSNRVFVHDPFFTHGGLPAHDPTSNDDPDNDGLTGISNAGAQQVFSHKSPEKGNVTELRNGVSISLDDIDHDGALEEITEGDLDIVEWYMLNAPPPALGRQTPQTQHGGMVFAQVGCAECHVPDWQIEAADPGNPNPHLRYAGDRRFFDLSLSYSPVHDRLEGALEIIADASGGVLAPQRGAFLARGLFTDFRYHDVGEAFYERQFDGSLVTHWRTAPLWGVGSSGPWGHDGANFDLYSVILRHGGAAAPSVANFRAAPPQDQDAVIAFLNSLVLYQTEELPCDIDGDHAISEHFIVAGKDVGLERFYPEFLFNTPVVIEATAASPTGGSFTSYAALNVDDAYGQDLEWIADSDYDGWPDKIDPAPNTVGYLDGVNSIPAFLHADLDGDGDIDGADLLVFQQVWQGSPSGSKAALPSETGPDTSPRKGLAGDDSELLREPQ
ncbi:MAG: hypothetical protein HUU16_04130 [Candidatus Omnitrophica bacterium]|nr:hypothetical protein [Candidatus Omnitrophota bacterium]